MDSRTITINNHRWKLRYVKMRSNDGECDAPGTPCKEIRIARRLLRYPRALAEALVHETIHASCFDLTEDRVEQMAGDIIRILEQENCLRNGGDA